MSDAIWFQTPDVAALNELHRDTAVSQMGIEIVEVGDDYIIGTMPVDRRTMQPFGLLHGGAAVLLLETLASAAANHCVDAQSAICVGVEVNCNHLRSVGAGRITGKAQAIHVGRSSMVWSLQAHDEQQRLVTVGRMTSAVVQLKPAT